MKSARRTRHHAYRSTLRRRRIAGSESVFIGFYENPTAGRWVDISEFRNAKELFKIAEKISSEYPQYEEYFIPASSDVFRVLGSEPDIKAVGDMVEAAHGLGVDIDEGLEIVSAYVEFSGDQDVNPDDVLDAYEGEYRTEEDWAYEYIDGLGGPGQLGNDVLSMYFDYEAFARDAFITDMYMSDSGYVFRRQ